MLTSEYIKCPVTSLKIYDTLLLTGQGFNLIIYSMTTNKLLLKINVFRQSRIHNIVENQFQSNGFILIGGRCVRSIQIHSNDNKDDIRVSFTTSEEEFNGWIWDAIHWNDSIYLVTAHNTVLKWNMNANTKYPSSSCSDQCILYSASFTILANQLVVAVGTVFNKVLLWKPPVSNSNKHMFVNTWKSFTGHEGVIFRIRFHPIMNKMLSVSDDRSIRIWSIDDETCLNVLYGHTARVWDAMYHNDVIVSIGEDTCCIIWGSHGNIIRKMNSHKGKSIWSLAVDDDAIITGGGDGGIKKNKISSDLSKPLCIELKLPQHTAEDNLADKKSVDFPRTLNIYSNGERLITTTNNGIVWKYFISTRSWYKVLDDGSYSSYCVVDLHQTNSWYAMGNLHGNVNILSVTEDVNINRLETKLFNGKIHSLRWLASNEQIYLIACGTEGIIKLIKVSLLHTNFSVDVIALFQLPYSKQRWLTCSVMLLEDDELFLVCGDRRGSLHLFQNNTKQPLQSLIGVHGKTGVTSIIKDENNYRHIYTTGRDGNYYKYIFYDRKLEKIDKQKACKGMEWLEGLSIYQSVVILYGFYMQSYFACWSCDTKEKIFSVNCGGGYRAWDVSFTSQKDRRHLDFMFAYVKDKQINICYKVQLEANVAIQESSHGKDVMKSKVLHQFKINGERYFLIASCSEDTTINFYICRHSNNKSLKRIHTIVGHIGGVKDFDVVTFSSSGSTTTYSCHFVSCGSRTSLKCFKMKFDFTCNEVEELDCSVSCSLIFEIYNPEMKLSKQQIKDPLYIDDMRYMDCKTFSQKFHSDNEMFDDVMWVLCACSDGFARIYFYWRNTFELAFLLDYHKHCVLNVSYVITEEKECYVIVSATDGVVTIWKMDDYFDEYLQNIAEKLKCEDSLEVDRKVFDSEQRIKFHECNNNSTFRTLDRPTILLKCHQSGVNDVAVRYCDKGKLSLLTGGDDNALSYAYIDLNSSTICYTVTQPNAHASAITGVSFLSNPTSNVVISTSIDQTLKVWTCLDHKNLIFKESTFTNIADVKSLFSYGKKCNDGEDDDGEDDVIIVSGVGTEIFNYSQHENHE